jgi:hypothetical protein
MAADQIVYCLEKLSDYDQFERLCHDLMARLGYVKIEPIGGMKDKGRDALHVSESTGEVTVFAYSVNESWRIKLESDANKIRQHGHKCDRLVFVCTGSFSPRERDEAIGMIRDKFGWSLELYGLERLRVLLQSVHNDLVPKHPQIFSLMHGQNPTGNAALKVVFNPTRDRLRQLAQIRLFNCGHRPIYIVSWYVYWGQEKFGGGSNGMVCEKGTLPIRIVEQDAYEILVPLDNVPIKEITTLGVCDGEGKSWPADKDNIKNFVDTALKHMPPPPSNTSQIDMTELEACELEILVKRRPTGRGFDYVDVALKNNGHLRVPVLGARIEWEFEVPQSTEPLQGQRVVETGGNCGLTPVSMMGTIGFGEEEHFVLGEHQLGILVCLLRPELIVKHISIFVNIGKGMCATESGTAILREVRAAAQSLVDSWHR